MNIGLLYYTVTCYRENASLSMFRGLTALLVQNRLSSDNDGGAWPLPQFLPLPCHFERWSQHLQSLGDHQYRIVGTCVWTSTGSIDMEPQKACKVDESDHAKSNHW